MKSDSVIYQVFQNIPVGVIAIDSNQEICEINRKAKEIFGIIYKIDMGHDRGRINEGDIVIIGDNSIGFDDGGVSSEDLKKLGVRENIKQGFPFLYIGKYMGDGEYRYNQNNKGGVMSLERTIGGKNIKVEINFLKKLIDIQINEKHFPYKYIKGIGHAVILDCNTLEVKFYQSKGYTVRKEDLKSILNGSEYSEKRPEVEMETEVFGQRVSDVLGSSISIETLVRAAQGEKTRFVNRYDEINGRPVRCSVMELNQYEKPQGAFLLVEDLSEINDIMKERDEIYKRLMELEEKSLDSFRNIIGESKAINDVKVIAKKAALSQSTILILGESGTGKSLLAGMIHEYSPRKHKRFLQINCGAIPENLLESELFGYVPGAFTGADREGKKGLISSAEGGTLFLDEISEMPLNLQVKLLHVIQEKKIIPIGSTKTNDVDVRFICATNRDIKKMVEEGKFREDLYYRINVIPIEMPPLRDRKEDLPILTDYLLRIICRRNNITYRVLTDEACNKLYSYNFPGNVRELENILERAVSLAEGEIIEAGDIILGEERFEQVKTMREVIEETERRTLINYLKRYGGDRAAVMKALDIKKTAFYEKIKKYGININSGNKENIPVRRTK